MIVEASSKTESAKDIAGTFLKLRSEAQEEVVQHRSTSGCPICSVYLALAKKGWLKTRGEIDYKNHLISRHGFDG